eukprot:2011877-Rhodomonas_salina.2
MEFGTDAAYGATTSGTGVDRTVLPHTSFLGTVQTVRCYYNPSAVLTLLHPKRGRARDTHVLDVVLARAHAALKVCPRLHLVPPRRTLRQYRTSRSTVVGRQHHLLRQYRTSRSTRVGR